MPEHEGGLSFEWDPVKADVNLRKHGVAFDEASTIFGDPLARTRFDPDHSDQEDRFVTIGFSAEGRLIIVVHTDRDERIRIVSARLASGRERREHEQ